jgi:hypothetical protein
MKCPKCGYDQKAKYGLKCGGCGYEFTFNPKDTSTWKLTDGKFIACIRCANQNGTAWFTKNQLYMTYCKRMSGSPFWWFVGAAIAGAFGIMCFWGQATPGGMVLSIIALILLFAGIMVARQRVQPKHFDDLLNRWRRAGKPIENLITKPSLHQPPPEWSEPDIYDYGVQRILIVERDILVDLFVKNSVHANLQMLVLSESGYPEYLLPIATQLLTDQPDLPVFLLHDATAHGTQMRERVLAGRMLPLNEDHVTDLGMFPEDFQKMKRTREFDPDNEARALPVDAMRQPFLSMGLESAFITGVSLSSLIEHQDQGRLTDGGSSFG